MSRPLNMPADLWHKSRPAPGDEPCATCRFHGQPATAPSGRHGRGKRWKAEWTETVNGEPKDRSELFADHEYARAGEVQAAKRQAVADKSLPPGTSTRIGVTTLAAFLPQYRARTDHKRSLGSNGRLTRQFATMLLPWFGGWDIRDLQHGGEDGDAVLAWQRALRAGSEPFTHAYAASTVDDMFHQLKAIFDLAKRRRAKTGVTENPCDEYTRLLAGPRQRAKREGKWTPEMVARAYDLELAPNKATRGSPPAWDRYRTALLIAATTGGERLSEVFGLGWTVPDDGGPETGDVHWAGQTIDMNISLARDDEGRLYFRAGKSKAALRGMTVPGLTLTALAAHMERYEPIEATLPFEEPDEDGNYPHRKREDLPLLTRRLVFSTGGGQPVIGPAFQSAARYGLNQAGLLPAIPIVSRAVQNPATGRFTANGGPQRTRADQRYGRPSDHGVNFHALREFWATTLEDWGVPLIVRKVEIGHERAESLLALGDDGRRPSGYDLTLNVYTSVRPDMRETWRRRLRAIFTAEFAPYLPRLLASGDLAAAQAELDRWLRPPREDGRGWKDWRDTAGA